MSLSENLYNLGALMKTNLKKKGVTGLTGNEGLTTLANKILDIECNGSSSKNIIANFIGSSISLGTNNTWLITTGDVVIYWGDGTSDTVNNPRGILSHTYADGLNEHLIIFDGTVTSLGNLCFKDCSGLTFIIIPDSVTSIGNQCFRGCSNLTSVIIPNSVTTLKPGCFWKCSSLINVVIPSSVTSLENSCFSMCSGLTNVIIPSSVISLGDWCFYECTSLINYKLYWETEPISYDAATMFTNDNTTFNIPFGTSSIYEEAGYPLDKLIERESS